MFKRILKITVVVALIAAPLIYVHRAQLMVAGLGLFVRLSRPVGPNQAVEWQVGPSSPESETRPPNVVVILADDLGFNDVSYFGGGLIQTPHIDALARSGVVLKEGYAGNAVCSPSRAMIMTGRYSTRFGFEFTPTPDAMGPIIQVLSSGDERPRQIHHIHPEEDVIPFKSRGMPSDEVTIAEVLKPAGYHTVHIGKWHLGRDKPFSANAQGFDESLLMASGLYLPVDSPDVVNSRQDFDFIDQALWNLMQYAVSFNGGPYFEPRGYLTDYFTQEAVKVIEANKNRPFFLYLAHWGVHTPLQATKADYEAVSKSVAGHRARVYAGMIRSVDRSVGQVMQALKDNGLDDDTLVIFTSDNGGADYIGVPNINKPYRGWKLTLFEGGVHVPFVMRWPGRLKAGMQYDFPVSHLDILPTAAAAANVTDWSGNVVDGVNLLPYLTGEIKTPPHRRIFWREGHYRAVREGNWKLQVSERPNKHWLYDLANDPTEQHNLAATRPEKVKALEALMADHNKTQKPSMWPSRVELPVWIDKTQADRQTLDDEYIYWPN